MKTLTIYFTIGFLLLLAINGCSTYHLTIIQVTPSQLEELKDKLSKEPVAADGTLGNLAKDSTNRNFTDVRNWGNIVYLTVDSQTPKVITTSASLPVTVKPGP